MCTHMSMHMYAHMYIHVSIHGCMRTTIGMSIDMSIPQAGIPALLVLLQKRLVDEDGYNQEVSISVIIDGIL